MQLGRFLLVGVFNTVVGLACIWAAMGLLKMDYRLANTFGYTVGCVTSFLLNRSWTFRSRGPILYAFARWLVVVGVSYGLNLLALVIVHSEFSVNAYLAQLAGVLVYTAATYLGARFFAFPFDSRLMRSA